HDRRAEPSEGRVERQLDAAAAGIAIVTVETVIVAGQESELSGSLVGRRMIEQVDDSEIEAHLVDLAAPICGKTMAGEDVHVHLRVHEIRALRFRIGSSDA